MPSVVHTDILLLHSTVVPSVVRLWSYLYMGICSCRLCGRPIVRSRLYLLVLSVVYRGRSCMLLLLVVGRWSYRLVGRLVVLALVSCYLIARSGHRLARGYLQAARLATLRRGGGFFKKGGGANRNQTRPHFYARGQKKCGFSAQNEENLMESGENWG